jgi:radical S-adenosyl methionine domain-containing protein 2
MKNNKIIPSVNFHLWEPCNMRCKFCFATFQDVKKTILPKGHLPKEEAIKIVKQLAYFGFEKITFAGGEPTLCPWISDLIKIAKEYGLTTMVVTNGSKLTDDFLKKNKKYLDWIAVSIDSLNESSNLSIGRKMHKDKTISKEKYLTIIKNIKKYGYGLKINTVINEFNYIEDFNNFIKITKPKRWKVLQVLPIKNQNDENIDSLKITTEKFNFFVKKHKNILSMVSENNNEMKGSYVMIDPAGRFFENSKGFHQYSEPILSIGVKKAFNKMNYDYKKFIDRDGQYNWMMKKNNEIE